MTTPQITIYDAITGETVTRDFNADELAQYEADKIQDEKDAQAKAKTDKATADKRQIILDRLGITSDEIKLLLG
jgi:hypothetical protein